MKKKNLFRIHKLFAGLECVMSNQQEVKYYNLVLLSKEQNNIKTLIQKSKVVDFEAIKKMLKPHVPLAIVINGKGPFFKKIHAENINPEEALNLAFPGAQVEDFCFQLSPAPDGTWISVIRSNIVRTLCEKLEQQGYFPSNIDIGSLGIRHLYPFINGSPNTLDLCEQQLTFKNGQIVEIESQDKEHLANVFISGEQVTQALIPAFAAAVSGLLKTNSTIHNTDLLENTRSKFHYTRLFRKTGIAVLALFLLLLSFNAFLFFNLSKKNEKYSQQLGLYQKQLGQLKTLRSTRDEKQSFIKQQNNLLASRKSFYADEIAATIPRGIQLEVMNLFPKTPITNKRNKTELLFDKNTIDIKGSSEVSTLLNDWITALENFNWVKKVTLLPYKESENGVGIFELEIKIKTQSDEDIIY